MMITVYLLKSLSRNYYYVGLTNNLNRRLTEHNSGKNKTTKPYRPFKLVYSRQFANRLKARNFEKFLKVRSNKEKIIKSL